MKENEITFDFAKIGDVNLHYAAAGSGENLVILLHGFPEFWYSWRYQISALSRDYRIVAPDMRGFNLSEKPADTAAYEIDQLVSDIAGLIRHFNPKKTVVVGHDWGASIAWSLALRHPELLAGVVALQVPPIPIWRANQTLRQLAASWYMFFFQVPYLPEIFLRLNDYALLKNALKNSTAVPGIFREEDLAEYQSAWRQPRALISMLNYYRANILKRLFKRSGTSEKVIIPALFIYGEKDSAVLPATVRGVEHFVESTYREIRIPTSAHWVQQEAPERVTQEIREFLRECF